MLTGVFASTAINPGGADGLMSGNPSLLVAQFLSVVAVAAYAAVGTGMILFVVRVFVGLRTSSVVEQVGIDFLEHAERAYVRDTNPGRITFSGNTVGR